VIGLEVPVLAGITGMSREEAVFDKSDNPATLPLSYPAADLDPAKAMLTVRQREGDERRSPEGLGFRYLGPREIEITRPAGFDDGAIYEFIYPAAEPTVNGLAFASTRDVVSYLRYGEQDEVGHPNPLADAEIEHALALGISQSGRFLRDFLYQGFNEDEAERAVFDGLIPHIAGSRKTFVNYRFSQPGRYSRQHEDHLYPGDQFPFTYAITTDPVSGQTDGIFAACEERGSCPKVIHTDTSTEVWQGRAALVVADGQGNPIPLPDTVRAFLIAGAPHFNPADAKSAAVPICRYPTNPLHAGPAMRALVVALEQWVSEGTAPPDSRYPADWRPASEAPDALTGVPDFAWIGAINGLAINDHAAMPPKPGKTYGVPRPRVDEIGHPLGALRLPAVEVPVASYLGWNERKEGFAPGQLCGLTGSMLPLAETRAEHEASGDPRPSLEEFYASDDDYLAKVEAASAALVAERLMLAEDVALVLEQAKAARGIP
jgi:Alpha/beta hydrolase domain